MCPVLRHHLLPAHRASNGLMGGESLPHPGHQSVQGGLAAQIRCARTRVLRPHKLRAAGHGWWLGVAISGFGLGLVGLAYCYNRRLGRRSGNWHHN